MMMKLTTLAAVLMSSLVLPACGAKTDDVEAEAAFDTDRLTFESGNTALEWNQIFVETLIAATTANSSSQRLGAIVAIAMFDARNGIQHTHTPIFYTTPGDSTANYRAAVISAAYTTLVGLFPPALKPQLDVKYANSLNMLGTQGGGGDALQLGLEYGKAVADAVLAWRSADGFSGSYPAFTGGTAIGQWRPIAPATSMSAQGLAFTLPFAVDSREEFRPAFPRGLLTQTYTDDFNAVKALGRSTDSTRNAEQTALAPFWEYNASVHWNQAVNAAIAANHLNLAKSSRLIAVLNIAMADSAITTWSAKRAYGADPAAVTWRPFTAITAADDGNPDTEADPSWLPFVTTPSHPEYAAGHPSLNGAAATVLTAETGDALEFTLTAVGQPSRTYHSVAQARQDGNDARVWGGMHYPSTVAISDAEGEAIAEFVNANVAQPLP